MPTLVLPLRITPDTDAMLAAALAARWDTLRLGIWRVPAGLNGRDGVARDRLRQRVCRVQAFEFVA